MFTGAANLKSAYFGQGSGPIFMDEVGCGSSHTALLACPYDPDTSEDNHGEDAGVGCGGECFMNPSMHTMPHQQCLLSDAFCWRQLPALMEMFVWLVVAQNMKGEWSCV